jgi:hypothetical protein
LEKLLVLTEISETLRWDLDNCRIEFKQFGVFILEYAGELHVNALGREKEQTRLGPRPRGIHKSTQEPNRKQQPKNNLKYQNA